MWFYNLMIFLLLITAFSCATLEDSGRAYFRLGSKVNGVEPADALLERMHKDQKLREITYGHLKSAQIIQCTLLRNQIYVASMKGPESKELQDAVKIMEAAYQESDDAFLAACHQILSTPLGKTFVAIQQEYLSRRKQEDSVSH